jgi:hypothetical protein
MLQSCDDMMHAWMVSKTSTTLKMQYSNSACVYILDLFKAIVKSQERFLKVNRWQAAGKEEGEREGFKSRSGSIRLVIRVCSAFVPDPSVHKQD